MSAKDWETQPLDVLASLPADDDEDAAEPARTLTAYEKSQLGTTIPKDAGTAKTQAVRRVRATFGTSSSVLEETTASATAATEEDISSAWANRVADQDDAAATGMDDLFRTADNNSEPGTPLAWDDDDDDDDENNKDDKSVASSADDENVEDDEPANDEPKEDSPTVDSESEDKENNSDRVPNANEALISEKCTTKESAVVDSNREEIAEDAEPTTTISRPADKGAMGSSQQLTTADGTPDQEALLTSTDNLFEQVSDKTSVTVKDIVRSLEAEFNCKMNSKLRKLVRERLTELMTAYQQAEQNSDNSEDEVEKEPNNNVESDVGDLESSESEAEDEIDTDDDEFEEKTKQPATRRRATTKSSKTKPSASRTKSSKKPRNESKKAAKLAKRVHEEQLRKRRLEELRVRNEELVRQQSAMDQERAQEIARKLDTNTEDLRLQRLESRLDLLQKLDHKRIACVQLEEQKDEPAPDINSETKTNDKQDTVAATEKSKLPTLDDCNDESSDDDNDDDMELEIEGCRQSLSFNPTAKSQARKPNEALSLLDLADAAKLQPVPKKVVSSPGHSMGARAALRQKLKQKQRTMGNLWLARELGYKTDRDHVEDCLKEERKKREIVLRMEQNRLKFNERSILRERMLLKEDEPMFDDEEDLDDDEDYKEEAEGDEEEDEEMAMAKEMEQEENDGVKEREDPSGEGVERTVEESAFSADNDDTECPDADDGYDDDNPFETQAPSVGPGLPTILEDESEFSNAADVMEFSAVVGSTAARVVSTEVSNNGDEASRDAEDSETLQTEEVPAKPKGPRNAAWKAILEQDARQARKKKRSGLVEEEADEEEEEEVAGLEDFGFVVKKKKADGEDDDADPGDFNEDDLKHVVDDISDDEGDEEAGEMARKAMDQQEEKERHKEMLRRMREGYDGRRGGIAVGGAGARGMHRFDELVAADNRADAKRLGLLNDDEIDSENEEGEKGDGDDEEEDEVALLDKMLKDRFLHRSSVEEQFSDDENEQEVQTSEVTGDGGTEDQEEMEQERLAKRFAKRARMQRLIEQYGHEKEFSQSKLIDEDETLQLELQRMKNGLCRKRSESSSSSMPAPTDGIDANKKQRSTGSSTFATRLFNAGTGSLAIALQAGERANKQRTSFVRGKSGGRSAEASSSYQKCIAFSHVVFHSSSDSRSHQTNKSQASQSSFSRADGVNPRKRVGSDFKAPRSTSFFSKIISTGGNKKRKM